jgi:polyphosphate glucokinase
MMQLLGIDIGGSGIKGGLVNIRDGSLVSAPHSIATPLPATPAAVAETVAQLLAHFSWQGPIGCTFPAVIKNGVSYTAANVDPGWVGCHGEQLLHKRTGSAVLLLNDADAAGIAEMRLGAGQGKNGVVIMLTLGTGIGSAIFVNGQLLPNSEFGHLEIRSKEAEQRAAARIRTEKKLSWERWAKRLNEVLRRMEDLFWPDLFILGGGISRKHEKFFNLLEIRTPIVPAAFFNQAGIVGAAIAAAEHFGMDKHGDTNRDN